MIVYFVQQFMTAVFQKDNKLSCREDIAVSKFDILVKIKIIIK